MVEPPLRCQKCFWVVSVCVCVCVYMSENVKVCGVNSQAEPF